MAFYERAKDASKCEGKGDVAVAVRRAFYKLGKDFVPGTYNIEVEAYALYSSHVKIGIKDDNLIVKMYSGKLIINATD